VPEKNRAENVLAARAALESALAEKAKFDRARAGVADALLKAKILVREARAAWKDERDDECIRCIEEAHRILAPLVGKKGGDS